MIGHVLLDFDGTIAIEDTTDRILERFAEPGWRAIEAEWEAQRIGSRECMSRQIGLLRATKPQFDRFIEEVHVDRGFIAFVEACVAARFHVTIVSDGLDYIVHGVMARTGVSVPVAANRLEHVGGDRWRLGFPFASANCTSASGNCKCAHGASPGPRVLVGDGRSDFCAAATADYVFAKGRLRVHCEESGIAHAPIADLTEATELFKAWHRQLNRMTEEASGHARIGHA
jgi:2-hydroxy-3-keto-5-methylthiopentenyl-1-phosphate phosphatase